MAAHSDKIPLFASIRIKREITGISPVGATADCTFMMSDSVNGPTGIDRTSVEYVALSVPSNWTLPPTGINGTSSSPANAFTWLTVIGGTEGSFGELTTSADWSIGVVDSPPVDAGGSVAVTELLFPEPGTDATGVSDWSELDGAEAIGSDVTGATETGAMTGSTVIGSDTTGETGAGAVTGPTVSGSDTTGETGTGAVIGSFETCAVGTGAVIGSSLTG
jgi:hypothetical protein